jgi:hypothetical protein
VATVGVQYDLSLDSLPRRFTGSPVVLGQVSAAELCFLFGSESSWPTPNCRFPGGEARSRQPHSHACLGGEWWVSRGCLLDSAPEAGSCRRGPWSVDPIPELSQFPFPPQVKSTER